MEGVQIIDLKLVLCGRGANRVEQWQRPRLDPCLRLSRPILSSS